MLNDSLIRTFIHSFTRFLTTISDNLIINFCQFEDYVGNINTLRYKIWRLCRSLEDGFAYSLEVRGEDYFF